MSKYAKICQRYAKDMLYIYQRYTNDIKIYDKYMPNICQRYTKDMPKIYLGYVKYMPKICQRYIKDI